MPGGLVKIVTLQSGGYILRGPLERSAQVICCTRRPAMMACFELLKRNSMSRSSGWSGVTVLVVLALSGCGKDLEAPPLQQFQQDPSPITATMLDPASVQECPAGGLALVKFTDKNANGSLDANESIQSRQAICNGQDGADGTNGADGTDGTDGQDAQWSTGPLGEPVPGKVYSACHHDYLYIPAPPGSLARAWLLFRHQANGTEDQGTGDTGFQVWNVDIADFTLISEKKNVTYCAVHWDAQARTLTYTVVDSSDGLLGHSGSVHL